MPDTMIGFRAHENDLELIEFVAGQLERIEAMLPVQIRSRGLSRQDVLRHCLAATASRYREGLDSQSQAQDAEPPGCFGDTGGIEWKGEGAYCELERARNGRFRAWATWLFEEREMADETFVRYFAPNDGESLSDTMLRAQQWCREVTKQAYARPRVTTDEPDEPDNG